MANHKQSTRICPQCQEEKTFDDRYKTCSQSCATAAKRGEKPPVGSETVSLQGDKLEISLPKTGIHTLEELLEYCKVDLTEWKVERFVVNKWEVGAKEGSKETGKKLVISPLFQVKATLVRKVEVVAARKEIEELKKLFTAGLPKRPRPITLVKPSGNMLEINIPDLHVGKLAWAKETGWENYDVAIAEDTHRKALDALLAGVSSYEFERVTLVVGNDLLNSDDLKGQTTKGTIVATDLRYHRTFAKVRNMMIETISRLKAIASVDVVMVPGNHDTFSVWHLGDSLEMYFHGDSNVAIDNTPTSRKYIRFGNVMLMFTHGDKGKAQDYPLLMATEQSQMFGQTQFREVHCGHTHQTKLTEQHGVRVRVLPALCAADHWHAENGFVGNIRSAEAYIWNKNNGLIGTSIFSLPHRNDQLAA